MSRRTRLNLQRAARGAIAAPASARPDPRPAEEIRCARASRSFLPPYRIARMTPTSFIYGSLMLLTLAGCVTPGAGGLFGETPGERFRKAMAERERYCSTHEIVRGETTCDILKLKSPDPLATPEGRFAHSIKLPPPHDEPKEVYRAGMTSEEYFKALCDAEAGEFIFKTVENVEGIFQMRPRQRVTDDMLQHLYAIEDPFGHENWETTEPEKIFVSPNGYRFLEKPFNEGGVVKYLKFFGYTARWEVDTMVKTPMQSEVSETPVSRYGYTWRGLKRHQDRELGIAGGELIIADLRTGQVLAVRRGYIRSGNVRNSSTGIWWLTGQVCPRTRERLFSTEEFIHKVLRPITRTSVQGGE